MVSLVYLKKKEHQLYSLLLKIKEQGTLLKPVYEASILLADKEDKKVKKTTDWTKSTRKLKKITETCSKVKIKISILLITQVNQYCVQGSSQDK